MMYETQLKREKLSHAFDFVCQYMAVDAKQLKQKSRKLEFVAARQVFYHLMRKYHYDVPFELIGGFVNYNHATVMHGVSAVSNRLATEPRYRKYIQELEAAYVPTIAKFEYVDPPIKSGTSLKGLQDRIDQYIKRFETARKMMLKVSNEIEEINQLLNKQL